MTTVPYTTQTISGYNASPPPDDGSQSTANKVTWAGIKTKLTDAIATLAAAINSQILSAFTNSVSGLDNLQAQATPTIDQAADYLAAYDASAGGNVKVIWSDLPLANSYINDFVVTHNAGTPNTKINVSNGQCNDSTNTIRITKNAAQTIDCTTIGALGLDAGSLAITTQYHVFVMRKVDGTTSAIMSTSSTNPTLPTGFTTFRRVGGVVTDGAAHFTTSINQVNMAGEWYDSGDQTITAGGTLTLPHGQATVPQIVQCWLHNVTNEGGYVTGQYALPGGNQNTGTNNGYGCSPNSSGLNVTFGSGASTFVVVNLSTGAATNITNADWKAVFRARS